MQTWIKKANSQSVDSCAEHLTHPVDVIATIVSPFRQKRALRQPHCVSDRWAPAPNPTRWRAVTEADWSCEALLGKPKRQLAASELRWPREVEGAKLGGAAWATQARLINKEPREIDLAGTD